MKRTNLVLDGELLESVRRVLGVKTYSATVNIALAETLRLKKIQGLSKFFGEGLCQGDLSQMRKDPPHKPGRRKRVVHAEKRR